MPLAIYTALESDVRVARALSLVLAVLGLALLLALRLLPELWTRRRGEPRSERTAVASAPHPQERRPGRPEPAQRHTADWQVRLSAHLGSFKLDVDLRGGAAPVALIGPNGAGKTTLLRLIAGVHRPDSGLIRVGDEVLYDSERDLLRSPEERRVAYVPQGFGLFPHLSVTDNVAFALHAARPRLPRPERRHAAAELLAGMDAAHLLERRPATLSGGERQRVALIRALLVDPLLLLLDEPLASLDAQARQTLRAPTWPIIWPNGRGPRSSFPTTPATCWPSTRTSTRSRTAGSSSTAPPSGSPPTRPPRSWRSSSRVAREAPSRRGTAGA